MEHPINITVLNDTNGVATPSDGIMGLFVKSVAVGNFALNTPYLLTKLADLVALGVTSAYDTTNGTFLYGQVSEFYQQAGDGALLWLFGIDKATTFSVFVLSNTFDVLIRSTAIADPANRVKIIGLCYEIPLATQSASDFLQDSLDVLVLLQAKQAALFQQGFQFSAVVDGSNMNASASPAALGTMAFRACPSISFCIASLTGNGVASVGFALGRFSRISVGHGMGAVEDGPMTTNTAYLTNGLATGAYPRLTFNATSLVGILGYVTIVVGNDVLGYAYLTTGMTATQIANSINNGIYWNGLGYTSSVSTYFVNVVYPKIGIAGNGLLLNFTYSGGSAGTYFQNGIAAGTGATSIAALAPIDITQLGQKQYMFLRTWFSHQGYYWNDGATCDNPTKQLSTQEYNRVANALSADALFFFIGQMGKNLPLDTKTGSVAQTFLNVLQAEFYNTYINPLRVDAGTGDLSDASMTVTGANFNSTKTLDFVMQIVPTPILGKVVGTVKFSSTL